MTNQSLLHRGDPGDKATISGSSKWNASLISRKPVRMEFDPDPAESEDECQKHVLVALFVFLALLIVLSGTVVYLLWAKVHGLY
jgi:hypothetical protein